jgi:hypothetical protein
MGHPDDGFFQAFLDGEVVGAEADELRGHLDRCDECRGRLEALEAASQASTDALLLLDREARLDQVRRRVFPRQATDAGVGVMKGSSTPGRFWGLSLPKAASIALLLTGAAASALPGSPVRRWVVQGWESLTGQPALTPQTEQGAGEPEELPPPTQETGLPETGAAIPVLDEGVEIWIHELPPEAELRVLWTDGEEAWIYAAEGTRFSRTGRRLEAYGPPGPVRIEIPRGVQNLIVGLDDTVLLRKTGEDLEISGPAQERTPSEIRFEAPGRSNDA